MTSFTFVIKQSQNKIKQNVKLNLMTLVTHLKIYLHFVSAKLLRFRYHCSHSDPRVVLLIVVAEGNTDGSKEYCCNGLLFKKME